MRLTLRIILALISGVTLVSCLFAFYQVRTQNRGLRNDLDRRAEVLAESLRENVEPLLATSARKGLDRLVAQFANRRGVAGVAVYGEEGRPIAVSPNLKVPQTPLAPLELAYAEDRGSGEFLTLDHAVMHVYAVPLHQGAAVVGALAVFHDASYIGAQDSQMWRENFLHVSVQLLLVTLITLLIVKWSVVGPVTRTAQWMRDLRAGRHSARPDFPEAGVFQPLTHEIQQFASSLALARASAATEARLRHTAESLWTPERLRLHVGVKLRDSRLFVVSNREPYERRGKAVEYVVPASGLVTALEPILRACDGTWIAQATGDADRDVVDIHDRVRVPPDEPQYTLRRVWLTSEEQDGYYFGFANEGLWPLCHIAHTRPLFRGEDWAFYRAVNEKFAQVVLEEMASCDRPALVVQDYHFALLPRLVKQARPEARVAIFWHIPWPNPEAFGICPWQRELLDGLLGADVVGFHIQSHCNNFLETVDHALECRVDWERFAIERQQHRTFVRRFPISVAFTAPGARNAASAMPNRDQLLGKFGVRADFLGVGVDRLDYTKGIVERFRGLERFLEKYPADRERFTFVQIAAPSRTRISRYQDLEKEVEAEASRINQRFETDAWRPIVLVKRQHSHQEIEPYYRAADLCLVTALHDGMNLVAKEFVAARSDEQGVLILSRFTGAATELRDALVVNPYDTEQLAEAVHSALEMDPEERTLRMQRMRQVIRERNIYRWAANLISELADIRLDHEAAELVAIDRDPAERLPHVM
jgi:alpha,alpha-trehalose-phosphate synthase [UDP-forming]